MEQWVGGTGTHWTWDCSKVEISNDDLHSGNTGSQRRTTWGERLVPKGHAREDARTRGTEQRTGAGV